MMRRISRREVAAISRSVAACTGAFELLVEATGPGTGRGLRLAALQWAHRAG
jgi:hypothetical protein